MKQHAYLLLFAALVIGLWVQRVHVDEPKYPVQKYWASDLSRYNYPNATYLHNELRSGNFPLWNPYQMAGQPFVALHILAGLYLPHLALTGLLPAHRALEAYTLVHLMLAGVFTWLFAGRLGLLPVARFTSVIVFVFSGAFYASIYQAPFVATQAWLPVIFWALHGLVTEVRPRWAVGLAIALAHGFLGGSAQGFLYELMIALAYGSFGLVFLTASGARLRVLALTVLSGLLAFGLVAPQLFLAIELTMNAVRNLEGIGFHWASYGSVSPNELLNGIFRDLGPEIRRQSSPLGWRITLPVIALPLALCGMLARRQRANWIFFLCAAVISAFFMLGRYAPVKVFSLFYSLPGGDLFRGPNKMDFVYMFLASLLMGIGVQGLVVRLTQIRVPEVVPRAVGALLVLLVAIDIYPRTRLEAAHPAAVSPPIEGAPSGLIQHLRSQPGRERVFIQTGIWFRPQLMQKAGMMHGIFAVPDYEPSMPGIYQDFLLGNPLGSRAPFWHGDLSLVEEVRGNRARVPLARSLDLMSVRYYATLPGIPVVSRTLRAFATGEQIRGDGFELYERPSALPRAYTVRRVLYEPDVHAALRRIHQDSFKPRQEAVVVAPAPRNVSDRSRSDNAGADRAEIVEYEPEEVVIAAECAVSCLLVLTDLYYPGWRAYRDGREVEVQRVNALFRGVQLEAGSHRVVYRYEPASFRVGLLVLLAASVLATLALVYFPHREDRVLGPLPGSEADA